MREFGVSTELEFASLNRTGTQGERNVGGTNESQQHGVVDRMEDLDLNEKVKGKAKVRWKSEDDSEWSSIEDIKHKPWQSPMLRGSNVNAVRAADARWMEQNGSDGSGGTDGVGDGRWEMGGGGRREQGGSVMECGLIIACIYSVCDSSSTWLIPGGPWTGRSGSSRQLRVRGGERSERRRDGDPIAPKRRAKARKRVQEKRWCLECEASRT